MDGADRWRGLHLDADAGSRGVDGVLRETLEIPRSVDFEGKPFAEYETGNLTLGVIVPERMGMAFAPNPNHVALASRTSRGTGGLEARGVSFDGEIFDTGVCHMAFFSDPGGNRLMLHHRYAPREVTG